jgi:hypothetical protein
MDAHRLMRESTPPTYLESASPPEKRRRQRGKDENNDILEHCEPPFFRQVATQVLV